MNLKYIIAYGKILNYHIKNLLTFWYKYFITIKLHLVKHIKNIPKNYMSCKNNELRRCKDNLFNLYQFECVRAKIQRNKPTLHFRPQELATLYLFLQ